MMRNVTVLGLLVALTAPGLAAENDLRKKYEEQMKQFEESIKKASDAEAREQLEKTRDEYKKAMEEPLKKADAEKKEVPPPPRRPNLFPNPDFQDVDALRRQLEQMQRDAQKRLELPLGPNDPRFPPGFPALEPKDIEGLFKELLDPNRQPGGVGGLPDGLFGPVGPRTAGQPRLGVKVEKVSAVLIDQLDLPKDSGLVLTEVLAGGVAEKAGLKANDILLKLGDKDVPTDPAAFIAMVGKLKGGEKLDAVVVRKGKKETVKGIELPDGRRPAGGEVRNEKVQVQINGDDVATLTATVDGVGYTIVGPLKNGRVDAARVVVTEGKESKEYETLDKMPDAQRATAERLLGRVRLLGR